MSRPARRRLARALAMLALAAAASTELPRASVAAIGRTVAAPATAGVPDPVRPAFTARSPLPLAPHRATARWAPVLRPTAARAAPSLDARVIAHLATQTPEHTTNIVVVLARRPSQDGSLWIQAVLPTLHNGSGWIPRSALGGYATVHTRLLVDRSRLTAALFRDGRRIFVAPVGIGEPTSPTPPGQFYIRDRVDGFGNPFYGPLAFGTSARSQTLTDWPAGGYIGIHGTNQPNLIPGRISHGCIRMRNTDILHLGQLMPVGTPLTIQ
jgi:lipoprotein-anchoring transpeptidase ErfK/SrfK